LSNAESGKSLRILYYGGGWPTNIGNAFIDIGAMAILRAAAPDAQMVFAGGLTRWLMGRGAELPRWIFWRRTRRGSRFLRDFRLSDMDDALEVGAYVQCDVVVISGMKLCTDFIQQNGPTVTSLASRGVPVFFLGAGGWDYSEWEERHFRDFLKQVRPVAFVSRDEEGYRRYADIVPNVHSGIDCGFFCSDAFNPFPLSLPPYVVATFDKMPEPELDVGNRLLLHAHQQAWGPTARRFLHVKNTLISDIPWDYLSLYAGAEEVHTDRVHACVAALAYGRKSRLYGYTPRASLFDAVGRGEVRTELVQLDMALLAEKKKAQVEFVRRVLDTLG
jgi:hypothetical protein